MFELSLHILDLVQNAVSAGARLVVIEVLYVGPRLILRITDDGHGMDQALLSRVESPFATTRTTRKVGLGIPMIKQLALSCGGTFRLSSTPGVGTVLEATFQKDHLDLPPLGDLPGTMRTLILGAPDTPDFVLRYAVEDQTYVFDTREIRAVLGGVSLAEPEVLAFLGEHIESGMAEAALEGKTTERA